MTLARYNPQEIEPKWQARWERDQLFRAIEDPQRPKYYCLEMLPYPSGRIHMGHVRNYSIGDVVARYKMMQGYNVLHPMGWDAFGLPAENAAIKHKIHPAKWTHENIAVMRQQLQQMGLAYDWPRELATCDPAYYRWEQLLFLRMLKAGLAYRKEKRLNWCEGCQTVLANEQVEQGRCWRCATVVVQRPMEQWFFKITDYAEELHRDIDTHLGGWPERVRLMQREWIGKSEGALVRFPLENDVASAIEIFTTRPDTLYGVTFLSVAWEHPLVAALSRGTPEAETVAAFVRDTSALSREARLLGQFEKRGLFTGAHARHPLTQERMPIYVANFVVMDYGTGAVMGVPAHDQRDFEFARKYHLPVRVVIQPDGAPLDPKAMQAAYEGEGRMVESGPFNGTPNVQGICDVTKYLEQQHIGSHTITYKLKDWCLSRQRYWGAPIPIVYCDACGTVPVRESDLPVTLPTDVPLTGEGGSPLAKIASFVQVACPQCSAPSRRETDTMDTFVESSWYLLRYVSPQYDQGMVDPDAVRYWLPIDQYIGGIEHAVGHLIYCRFFTKVMRDLNMIDLNEPVTKLLTQGMVCLDGSAMSKSRGNVVDPDEIITNLGADTARLFILFAAPPEKDLDWNDRAVEGMHRFLSRVWRYVQDWVEKEAALAPARTSESLLRLMHKTIKRVTDDLERMHFNTAIAAIMEYVNALPVGAVTREAVELLPVLLAPFAPHIAEELWQLLGHTTSIVRRPWPTVAPQWLVEETWCVVVQVNGKLRDRITVPTDSPADAIKAAALTEKVRTAIGDRPIANVVYVPGKLVNIVVR